MRPFVLVILVACATADMAQAGEWHDLVAGGRSHRFYMANELVLRRPSMSTLPKGARGVPIRFESGAVGVLLNQVIIGASAAETLDPLLPSTAVVRRLPFADDVFIVQTPTPEAALLLTHALQRQPGIRYAHPDLLLDLQPRGDPTAEPLYPAQWHLAQIQAPAAWSVTTGGSSTIIAIIDLGFEQHHPDLTSAWYINQREIANNRRDDDGNGYVDDVSGWNFAINGPNLIYGASSAHGTAAAGVIGARADGTGVAGVCPGCTVLPLVIDNLVSNAVAAFHYARMAGVSVISNSWGYAVGTPTTDALVEAIQRAADGGRNGRGTTIVFAMSNSERSDCRGPEPDISSLEHVLAVSSVDSTDKKITTAGYGPCMDLVAPSSGSEQNAIATTDRPGERGYNRGADPKDFLDANYTNKFYGTSAATPQVAGAFGLLYSYAPHLTSREAATLLLSQADKVSTDDAGYDPVTGHSIKYGFGRVNIGRAVEGLRTNATVRR